MSDLRLWSRELIVDFIDMYKSFPCLWKVKSAEYKNKYTKSIAYKELVVFCKKRGFPDATRDFVVRKVQSLRGSFRKELRKTRQYKRAGKKYQANLWYYHNLMFTKDQEVDAAEDDDDGNQSDDDDGCQGAEDVSEELEVEEEEMKYCVDVKPSTTMPTYRADSPQSPSSPPPASKKRKRQTEDCLQPEFLDIGQETSKFKELSEFELTGMSIAKKLARMDSRQAIYAESIINNVIRQGLLMKLKDETDLCDSLCGKRIAGSHLPS